ncbi:MAG: hypothetical protein JNK72_15550 [Myxococcales bacterium]|nr:hypothetical protein [Myxococcales bacterium]
MLLLIPLAAGAELVAEWVTEARVPREADWRAAQQYLRQTRRDGDLVASAPLWTDPLARRYFGDLISLADAARPDATRYRRALVATIRGREHPDFQGWRETAQQRFGPITVRTLENPAPAQVRYDLIAHLHPPDARGFRVLGNDSLECQWRTGINVMGGGLGQGALAPPNRFTCSNEGWNYLGVTVIEDMEHRGRQCIWSHPVQGGVMATEWPEAQVAARLHGHHGLAYEAERGDDEGHIGADVELRALVDGEEVGRSLHHDGEGWKVFDFDTLRFANGTHRLRIEIRTENAGMRHYCFEGDLR